MSGILQSIGKTEYIRDKFPSKSLSVQVLKAWFCLDENDSTSSDFCKGFIRVLKRVLKIVDYQ